MKRKLIIIFLTLVLLLSGCNNKTTGSTNPAELVNPTEPTESAIPTPSLSAMIIIGNEFGNTYFDMKQELEIQGFSVVTVGVGSKDLFSSCPNHENIEVKPDINITDINDKNINDFSLIFIPAGKHFRQIQHSEDVKKVLNLAKDNSLYISSVCAGNFVLANVEGLIEGCEIATSTITEDSIKAAGGTCNYSSVVVDDVFVTGAKGGGKKGGGNKLAPTQELAETLKLLILSSDTNITQSSESILDEKALKHINDIVDSLSDLDSIISFSIVEKNEIVRTKYYNNVDENFKNNVFSVTKSITSMLIGIAIDEGYFTGVNQTIDEFIDNNEYELTTKQKDISIEDILTMTIGLYWNSDLTSEYHSLKSSKDKLSFILDRQMKYTPGNQFNYSDGAAHMMSIIFSKAVGKSLHEYAIEKIFTPLGIENTKWNADEDGNSYGGFDLYLSNEDMIKIGTMVKNNGTYNGVQVVPSSWISISTSPKVLTGSGSRFNSEYGYYWWVGDVQGVNLYTAIGHGGQFINIVPEFDLVITASCYGAVPENIANNSAKRIKETIINKIIPLYIDQKTD